VNSLLAETPGYQHLKKEASLQVKRKQKLLKKRLAKPIMRLRQHHNRGRESSSRGSSPSSKRLSPEVFEVTKGEEADTETEVDHTGAPTSFSPHFLASLRNSKMLALDEGARRQGSGIFNKDSEYDVYRCDESGFSSGDSSSSSNSLSSSSSSDSEEEKRMKRFVDKLRRKKKVKIKPPRSLAIDNVDDDDDDGLGVNMGGNYLPFSTRKAIVADTREQSNIESILSKLLFERLISCYVTIVESSAQANNWILVDRTSPDHSPTAELMLEHALRRTQASPVIIVIDSMSRFFSAPATNKIAMQQGKELLRMRNENPNLKKVEDLQTATFANAKNCEECQIPCFREFTEFDDWRKFAMQENLPFYPEEHQKQFSSDTMHPKSIWSMHYTSTLFSSGTHYVILDEKGYNFNRSDLGSVGYIFANGGNAEYKQIRSCIRNGIPSVMLMNTGSATQAFCSLRAGMQWKNEARESFPNITSAEINSSVQASLQVLQHEDKWAYKFGIR
jgi:hypothetical protein